MTVRDELKLAIDMKVASVITTGVKAKKRAEDPVFYNVHQEDFVVTGMYRYRIISTLENSNKYGPCSVCGKHCSEVFMQFEQRSYELDTLDKQPHGPYEQHETHGWTEYQCKHLVGHKECLINSMR